MKLSAIQWRVLWYLSDSLILQRSILNKRWRFSALVPSPRYMLSVRNSTIHVLHCMGLVEYILDDKRETFVVY